MKQESDLKHKLNMLKSQQLKIIDEYGLESPTNCPSHSTNIKLNTIQSQIEQLEWVLK